MSTTKKSIYFENLDGIRAIAFSMVFLYHFFAYMPFKPGNEFEKKLNQFIFEGHLGVNLFFVLSGFLITYLLIAEKEETGRINIAYFYIRRILRIWPLYFLVVILGFCVYPLLTHQFSVEVVKSNLAYYVFFLNNFGRIFTEFGGQGNDILGVLWSIAVEEQFYLFWPLVLAFVSRKYYVHVFAAVIVISLLYRYANAADNGKLYYHTFSVMSDLAVGAVLAYHAFFKTKWFLLLQTCRRYVILGVYVLLFLLVWFLQDWARLNTFTIVTERLILSLFFAFMIGEQSFSNNSLFKLKNAARLGKAGVISYGLYCLHMYSIIVLQKFNLIMGYRNLSNIVFGAELMAALGISLFLAYICHRYFEKKFLVLKEKFLTIQTR